MHRCQRKTVLATPSLRLSPTVSHQDRTPATLEDSLLPTKAFLAEPRRGPRARKALTYLPTPCWVLVPQGRGHSHPSPGLCQVFNVRGQPTYSLMTRLQVVVYKASETGTRALWPHAQVRPLQVQKWSILIRAISISETKQVIIHKGSDLPSKYFIFKIRRDMKISR